MCVCVYVCMYELLSLRKQRDQTDGDRIDHSVFQVCVCVCAYVCVSYVVRT